METPSRQETSYEAARSTAADLDVDDKDVRDGYPKLARLMACYPETAIVRRFGELNMINILRLQAELQDMEHQLKEIRSEDMESGDRVRESYVTDFLMRDWKEDGDPLQYEMLLSIGKKLKEYNLALSQILELNKIPKPSTRELEFLRRWLIRPSMGDNFLSDLEAKVWGSCNDTDFVTLSSRDTEEDAFTRFLHGTLLDIYHRVYGHRRKSTSATDPEPNFRAYTEGKLARLSNTITAMLSSVFPTVAILILYLVDSMFARIGLIIGFTALFAFVLSMFTSTRRVEVFAATAAFAAVEVVFVGSIPPSASGQ
ncbi:hypothetical protein BJX61DRAFT_539519 [Aspergillus egyptiacus]|nr:hypothetical protein BJX61DRAFT_539519 [Aspergillus egyptiacus]